MFVEITCIIGYGMWPTLTQIEFIKDLFVTDVIFFSKTKFAVLFLAIIKRFDHKCISFDHIAVYFYNVLV